MKGQTLTTEISDNLPLLLADRDRLKEIILNLIINALKFNKRCGEITVRAIETDKIGAI